MTPSHTCRPAARTIVTHRLPFGVSRKVRAIGASTSPSSIALCRWCEVRAIDSPVISASLVTPERSCPCSSNSKSLRRIGWESALKSFEIRTSESQSFARSPRSAGESMTVTLAPHRTPDAKTSYDSNSNVSLNRRKPCQKKTLSLSWHARPPIRTFRRLPP